MPARASRTIPCTYLRRNGLMCGRNCFNGTCSQHVGSARLSPCRLCGRGTQSVTGICTTIGLCKTAQHTALEGAKRAAKREAPPVTAEDLAGLVDELVAEFAAAEYAKDGHGSLVPISVLYIKKVVRTPLTIMQDAVVPEGILKEHIFRTKQNKIRHFAAEILCAAASEINLQEWHNKRALLKVGLGVTDVVDLIGQYTLFLPYPEMILHFFNNHTTEGYGPDMYGKGPIMRLWPHVPLPSDKGATLKFYMETGYSTSVGGHAPRIGECVTAVEFWEWLLLSDEPTVIGQFDLSVPIRSDEDDESGTPSLETYADELCRATRDRFRAVLFAV